jgi:excisionase family DNA binding protein
MKAKTMHRITRNRDAIPATEVGSAPIIESFAFAPLSVRIPTAVKLTGIGRSKIYELIQEGEIEVVKIGAATLITYASLERLLEKNRSEGYG